MVILQVEITTMIKEYSKYVLGRELILPYINFVDKGMVFLKKLILEQSN